MRENHGEADKVEKELELECEHGGGEWWNMCVCVVGVGVGVRAGLQLCVYPASGKPTCSQLTWQSSWDLWWMAAAPDAQTARAPVKDVHSSSRRACDSLLLLLWFNLPEAKCVWEGRGVGGEPLRAALCLLDVEKVTFSRISIHLIKLLRPSVKRM